MLTVKLTYFNLNGKYYTDGEFEMEAKPLFIIWDEIKKKLSNNDAPGLINWHNDFIVLVDVPEYEHAHPYIIMPSEKTSVYSH